MATNFNAIQASAWNWLGRNFLPCSVEKEGREIEFVSGSDVFIVLVFLPSSLTDCACVHVCVCARECTWHVSMSPPRVKFFLALSYMHLRACVCAHVCVCISAHIRSLQEGNVTVISLCQSLHEGGRGGRGAEISNQQAWTGPCVEETGVFHVSVCTHVCVTSRYIDVNLCACLYMYACVTQGCGGGENASSSLIVLQTVNHFNVRASRSKLNYDTTRTRQCQTRFWTKMQQFITARKESWGKVIFSEACVKNSVHRGGVSRSTPGGGVVSRPTHGGGGILACTEADTPPRRRLLLRRYASYWNAFLSIKSYSAIQDIS